MGGSLDHAVVPLEVCQTKVIDEMKTACKAVLLNDLLVLFWRTLRKLRAQVAVAGVPVFLRKYI